MGNPKQKWTAEEEQALIDGIAKHGVGKWKLIQKDPQFHLHLSNRTNIDLKDKWRNMSTAALQGSSTRIRTPKPQLPQDAPAPAPVLATATTTTAIAIAPSPAVPTPPVITQTSPVLPVALPVAIPVVPLPVINHAKEEPAKDFLDARNISRNPNDTTEMIFEALSVTKEQNGMDIGSIISYIEQRVTTETPQNFRKQLGAKLRRLVLQGRLEKADNRFRLKKSSLAETNTMIWKDMWPKQPLVPAYIKMGESLEEAAKTAAYKVAEAEEKTYFAAVSVREAERLSKMQEEADAIYQLAQEICDRCHSNDVLLVA